MTKRLIDAPLFLWLDQTPRTVAEQMALDEALWAGDDAVLRLHSWAEACVSFGYFLRWAEVQIQAQEQGLKTANLQRRWTGGGLVFHHTDLAFTLAIPSKHWRGKARFQDSIAWIHAALAQALQAEGLLAEIVTQEQGDALNCFAHPVVDDLWLRSKTDHIGRKIAGAGQRRHRQGLLHQGSLQLSEAEQNSLSNSWPMRFAAQLSGESRPPSSAQIHAWENKAQELLSRYQAETWQRKR